MSDLGMRYAHPFFICDGKQHEGKHRETGRFSVIV